jgi:AAA+ superfamily predicted ATPase
VGLATPPDRTTDGSAIDELLPALGRLDELLRGAVTTARAAFGPEAAQDPHRGLYVGDDEVDRLLARAPGAPLGPATRGSLTADPAEGALGDLARACSLDPFDLDVVLVALAPELDLRYERLYAYLQDDVTRRRPSVDLVLNLLCGSQAEKLDRRRHFAPDAPLVERGVVELVVDPAHVEPPLLAHVVKLDEQVVRLLLGQDGLGTRLAPWCSLVTSAAPLDAELETTVLPLVEGALRESRPLCLSFHGAAGAGRRRAAEALAARAGVPLLAGSLANALEPPDGFESLLAIAQREAAFRGAILYLGDLDAVREREQAAAYRALLRRLRSASAGVTVVSGIEPWAPARESGDAPPPVVQVAFPVPAAARRRLLWEEALGADADRLRADDLAALATRFRLTPGRVADAVAAARLEAQRRGETGGPLAGDLYAAARAQAGHGLGALARKVVSRYGWNDIVLPTDRLAQLREICDQIRYRSVVYDEWGFERRLSLGKGLNVLFSGPSGTGKTMAAEIMAGELELDLYKIDLSTVVSKYIGETEKNLSRIFAEAATADAILFFDEADALFGRRSEVRDSHDRYANIEISYLLQRMEEYEGVVILATNLRRNMDDAFVRRMHASVDFPLPGPDDRRRIWESIWPSETPRSDDVDLEHLALRFELAGGNIRNIALGAAFLAAADGGAVAMAHLLHATRREYQKMGKVVAGDEFDRPAPAGAE